jgi:putative peptidoglycan lipid II flippase
VSPSAADDRPHSTGGLLRRIAGYNVISAGQIALTVLFQVLLARKFGASLLTDAYLASVLLINFLSTMASALAETFTQYYHEIKAESPHEAVRFYQAVLNVSLAVGLLASAGALVFAGPLVALLAPGFSGDRLAALRSVFSVLALGLVGSAALRVNATLLRAELRFAPMYVLGLLTPGLNVLAILACGPDSGIRLIAAAGVASTMIGLAVQQLYIKRVLGMSWAPVLWHDRLVGLIGNSLLLRLGHQIWDFKDVVTTNVLSVLPGGTVTLYLYGARVISMAFSLASSASREMFMSLASELAARRDFESMRTLTRRGLIVFTGMLVAVLLVLTATLPELLAYLVGARLSAQERAIIYGVFLASIPFYLLLSVEAPWVTIAIAMKQGGRVALIGAAFIAIFWGVALVLRPTLGLYAIPPALAIGQLHSYVWYRISGRRVLRRGTPATPEDRPLHAAHRSRPGTPAV